MVKLRAAETKNGYRSMSTVACLLTARWTASYAVLFNGLCLRSPRFASLDPRIVNVVQYSNSTQYTRCMLAVSRVCVIYS